MIRRDLTIALKIARTALEKQDSSSRIAYETNLARYLMRVIGDSPQTAALRAQEILGLEFMADTHDLRAAVIKQLLKG